MKSGILPSVLVEQVRSTAPWLWDDRRAAAVVAALNRVERAQAERERLGASREEGASDAPAEPARDGVEHDHLRLLLAAHFSTVATFVPTDVDARIRHHAWVAIDHADALAAACDVVDEVASWDARWVSARTIDVSLDPSAGSLSGHDGEWLAVRAGALGRALVLGATALVERLVAALDGELEREEKTFVEAFAAGAPARRALAAATIVAHNLGDLSRVVEAWPGRAELASVATRYIRLGHPDGAARRRAFVVAGVLNKALMSGENHRFLWLRKARALRSSRALLLPIGPWFDTWGETVARHEGLSERDRSEVIAALLELHAASPEQQGCLRALAGIHRATRGGLERHVAALPARLRKNVLRGKVRDALAISSDHFEARVERRYRAERDQLR